MTTYFKIDLSGTTILGIYPNYKNLSDTLGASTATNISKLTSGAIVRYYSVKGFLWSAMSGREMKNLTVDEIQSIALNKAQKYALQHALKISINIIKNLKIDTNADTLKEFKNTLIKLTDGIN